LSGDETRVYFVFFSLASPLLILTLDDAGSIVTSSYVISNVSSNVYL